MSEKELDVFAMTERLQELPPEVQERIAYIVQGAAMIANHYAAKAANQLYTHA